MSRSRDSRPTRWRRPSASKVAACGATRPPSSTSGSSVRCSTMAARPAWNARSGARCSRPTRWATPRARRLWRGLALSPITPRHSHAFSERGHQRGHDRCGPGQLRANVGRGELALRPLVLRRRGLCADCSRSAAGWSCSAARPAARPATTSASAMPCSPITAFTTPASAGLAPTLRAGPCPYPWGEERRPRYRRPR